MVPEHYDPSHIVRHPVRTSSLVQQILLINNTQELGWLSYSMTDVYQLSVIDIKPRIGHRSLMAISTGSRASTMYIYIIIHTSAC